MNKILIIGGSSSLGVEIIKLANDLGIDVRSTYFQNKEKLFGLSEDAMYFNYNSPISKDEVDRMLDSVSIVIDCSNSPVEVREDLIERFSNEHVNIKYVSVGQLSDAYRNNDRVISIRTGLMVGKGTLFDKEILLNLAHGIIPLPIPTLSTGRPVHVKDVANIILKLIESERNFKFDDDIVIEGSSKITISHTIKEVINSYNKTYLFSFYLKSDWLVKLNNIIREKSEYGFSDSVITSVMDFSLEGKGVNASKLSGVNPLSVHARYIEDSAM